MSLSREEEKRWDSISGMRFPCLRVRRTGFRMFWFLSHLNLIRISRRKKNRRLSTKDGKHIDTRNAIVQLAEIPFVRLRHGLPASLVSGDATFSKTVSALQRSFSPAELAINVKNDPLRRDRGRAATSAVCLVCLACHEEVKIERGQQFHSLVRHRS